MSEGTGVGAEAGRERETGTRGPGDRNGGAEALLMARGKSL